MLQFRNIMLITLLFALMALWSCEDNYVEPETNPNPNMETGIGTLFFNGNIYTVNADQEWAEAMYIEDGEIQFIGTTAEVESQTPTDAERIDLEGLFVMPGIHDVHLHPLEAVSDNFHFVVDDSIEDPEDYATDVATAMAENPGNDWLLGWGHWLETILNAERLPKEILDDVAPDRPVAIMEQTSHSIWCNSKALELMGIDNSSSDPQGGIYMREEDGEINGLLIDNAGNLLIDLALTPSAEREENDYQGLVNVAMNELAKNGITSICDARTYWKRNHHKTWKRLEDENRLTCRVNLGLWAYPTEEDDTQLATIKSLYSNDPNSLLKINQIKLYSDGIVHNTTCAMHDDFLVNYFGTTPNNGLNYFTETRLAQYIAELEPIGFDFHIHTIGNRGVHESLNAIEQSGTSNGRHRLTHVEFVNAADQIRFAQLNVTADAQVAGDFTQPQHWHDNDYLIGSSLTNSVIPLKSLHDAGARITLSSDWDVSDLNPFVGLQNAVTRIPQNLTLVEAIKAYTINAAYVMRQENTVGSLKEGNVADFIVLDRNIFDIPTNQINQTVVLETYLNGELVYSK